METPWMTRQEAASYLRISLRTLEMWAAQGDGPPYHRLRGRLVRYHKAEVDQWAQDGTLRLHTADDGQAAPVLQLTRRKGPQRAW